MPISPLTLEETFNLLGGECAWKKYLTILCMCMHNAVIYILICEIFICLTIYIIFYNILCHDSPCACYVASVQPQACSAWSHDLVTRLRTYKMQQHFLSDRQHSHGLANIRSSERHDMSPSTIVHLRRPSFYVGNVAVPAVYNSLSTIVTSHWLNACDVTHAEMTGRKPPLARHHKRKTSYTVI